MILMIIKIMIIIITRVSQSNTGCDFVDAPRFKDYTFHGIFLNPVE